MPDRGGERLRPLEEETRPSGGQGRPLGPQLVPGLTILYHADLERIGERCLLPGLAAGCDVLLTRGEPGFAAPGRSARRPLADPHLSRRPVRLSPGPEPGSVLLVRGDSGTSVAVDGERVAAERVVTAAEVARGAVLLLAGSVVVLLSPLDPILPGDETRYGLVGESPGIVRVRREIRRVAGLDLPVLVRGETGTGKELVARALHDAGPRAARPFLAVNMGAVPPALAAAELFGAGRGAYTGADRHREGYFGLAHGGTLFLDEIGETPPEVQPLLLRALETGEIQPVGGGEPRRVDVRLVAATDADLEEAVAAGRFRAPLLHRLGGYRIDVPPLRARREDVGRLFRWFLAEELEALGEAHRLAAPAGGAADGGSWVPPGLVALLAAHDWPGNVRQLRQVVRRLVVAGRDGGPAEMWLQVEAALAETAVPRPRTGDAAPPPRPGPPPPAAAVRRYRRPEEVGEEELLAALRANAWRLQPTAAQLGISRGALYDRIEQSTKIRKAADLSRQEIAECAARCGGDVDAMAAALEVSGRGLKRRMTQLGMGRG